MTRRRVGILVSGRGSNMAALLAAAQDPTYPATIVTVGSNVPDAGGLTRARDAGIATFAIDHRAYREAGRAAHDAAMTAALEAAGVELVALAGYMRLLTPGFVEHWRDRLINIHPSLLPAYRGLDTHARALADGVRIAGCSVHYVRPEMDVGPIIAQAAVPVMSDDTPDTLGARVLVAEHRLYPLALRLVCSGAAPVVRAADGSERVALASGLDDGTACLIAPSGSMLSA